MTNSCRLSVWFFFIKRLYISWTEDSTKAFFFFILGLVILAQNRIHGHNCLHREPAYKVDFLDAKSSAMQLLLGSATKPLPRWHCSHRSRRLSVSDTTPQREEAVFPIAAMWLTRQQHAATARKMPVQPIWTPCGRHLRRRRQKAGYATTPLPLEGAAIADRY